MGSIDQRRLVRWYQVNLLGNTAYTYCTPSDVRDFLLTQKSFGANSSPNLGQVSSLISQIEGDFERRSRKAWRPRWKKNENHDLESLRSRHKELFDRVTVPRPIHLYNNPVIPFDAARGHKIEVYEGAEPWTDWLAKTEGRNADWWADYELGILYVRKSFIPRRHALVRVTYEHGRPITTLTDNPLAAGGTTVAVGDTEYYESRGWIRIDDEYIYYTGKTTTTFTGCLRGQYNTEDLSHIQTSEIYQCPDHVRGIIIKKVAARVLENERFITVAAESPSGGAAIASVIETWNKEFETALGNEYQYWGVF